MTKRRRTPTLSLPHHGFLLISLLLLLLLLNSFPGHVAGQNDTTSDGTEPPDDMYNYGRKFNPSMAIIMVVLVSAFFLMGFFSVYVRQCAERRYLARGSDAPQPGPFALGRMSLRGAARGLDRAVIETFPTFMYSSVKGLKIGKGSLECAVCLNEFADDHVLRLLPKCSHVFHHDCVDTWLFSHNTCPVCRANLVPEPGETIEPPIIQSELDPVLNHGEPSPDHVPISIDNNSTVSPQTDENNHRPNKTKPPRSRSTGMRFTRLFSRSHSTGHSLVQAGEDQERFTLRLPDNVRNQMIIDAQLNRAKSCTVAFPRARSMRTGYRRSRSGGGRNNFNYERFDKEERTGPWGFSMTPPFISRTGSVRSPLPRGAESDGTGHTPTRSSSKSGKPSQFDRIFLGLDIENGERSRDPLRAHSPL